MDIREIRRTRLRQWFSGQPLPEKEKSYLSQLINGKSSFGEKAARRIEHDYGMPLKHLDSVSSSDKESENIELDENEKALIACFRRFPDAGKREMMALFRDKAEEYDRLFDELAKLRQAAKN
ncbi:hypothetical protein N5923_21810 [Erwiniaceae bacterium BAC15a-03b]|uniref:Uncharacterized protein n=1 Tax=Winslowiella arboricola TaxID=2978220 RepID=A0A9J6PZ01_9GAMM|nr:hypothetical protein [Winslowiella arboricola]MCU5774716.1 hypothetical protein [Winslowiella arboricola]MCU5780132.1 hypothetical protein [Winslowiella arboricola]